MMLKQGDLAPSFSLPDQEGTIRTLSECIGSWTLLYFYPKDATPGCTIEAQRIRDAWSEFVSAGIMVFGISADTVASHRKFAEKQTLPFPLLADEEKEIIKNYGVWGRKRLMGRDYEGILRTSFLIAPDGTIAKIYEEVKPHEHAAEVLLDVKEHL